MTFSGNAGQLSSSLPNNTSPESVKNSSNGTENSSPDLDKDPHGTETTIKLNPLITLAATSGQDNKIPQSTSATGAADTFIEPVQSNVAQPAKVFGQPPSNFKEIFGRQGGRFHPYASIKGEWTDNLYNINTDEISSLQTIFSPGIWFGLPRIERIPVSLNPHNAAIGGMRFSTEDDSSYDRFMAYILGGLDARYYSHETDLNYTAWRLEGLLQYNMPFGISFRIHDKFSRDRDKFDIGSFTTEDFSADGNDVFVNSTPSRIRNYYSNQANLAFLVNVSEKYSILIDYLNFSLDYDDEVNEWLDRIDNRYSIKLNYRYSPKTSFFLEYDSADIEYNTATENDSSNIFYYAGIIWKGTAKTSIKAKGGYQTKNYDSADVDNNNTFAMEMDLNYLITDKTHVSFNLYKALEESDSLVSNGKDTVIAKLLYNQNFLPRIKGNVVFSYETSDYKGFNRISNDSLFQDRLDKSFLVRPAIQYIARDWLMTELAYSFENRNSTDNVFDFTTQTLIFSLNAAF